MSLLTIAQDAANEVGFNSPGSLIGNTNTDATRLLRLCKKEGRTLAQSTPAFQILEKTGSITLVTGDQDYTFPADLKYIIPDTTWDRTDARRVINPITPNAWQFYKAWNTVSGLNFRARIRNNQLEFEQEITAADNGKTIHFEYISKYWAISLGTGDADQTEFLNDTDTTVFCEELFTQGVIWRLEKSLGLEWQSDFSLYEKLKRTQLARTKGSRMIDMAGDNFGQYLGVNVPDDNFGI